MKKTSLFTNYSRNLKIKGSTEKPALNNSLNKTQNAGKYARLNISLGKSTTPFQNSKNRSINYNSAIKTISKTIETITNFNCVKKKKDNNTISASKSLSSKERDNESLEDKVNNSKHADSSANLIKLKKSSNINSAGIVVPASDIKILDNLLSFCADLAKSKGSRTREDYYSKITKHFQTVTETLNSNKYKKILNYLLHEFKELQTLAFNKKNNNFQQFSSVNLKKNNTKLLVSTPAQQNRNGDLTNTLQSIEVLNTSGAKAKPIYNNSKEKSKLLLNKYKTPVPGYCNAIKKGNMKKSGEQLQSMTDKKKENKTFIQSLNAGHLHLNLKTTTGKSKPLNRPTTSKVINTEPNKEISFNGKDPVNLFASEDLKSEEHRLKINKNVIDDLEAIYFEDKVKPRCNSTFSDIPKLRFDFISGDGKRKKS